jgi:ubiquinone/menaquinone biosynthesis C-methylase UbiE
MMAARDAMTYINDMDDKVVQMFIDRLEFRGKDPTFVQYRDAYIAKMRLSSTADVLEIGCGTGVVARAIAARPGFAGHVTGIDQSPAFIAAAQHLAAEAGVEPRTAFQVGDVHAIDSPDARFDAVVAHTVISHVLDPLAMLRDAARVVRPGGHDRRLRWRLCFVDLRVSRPRLGQGHGGRDHRRRGESATRHARYATLTA